MNENWKFPKTLEKEVLINKLFLLYMVYSWTWTIEQSEYWVFLWWNRIKKIAKTLIEKIKTKTWN